MIEGLLPPAVDPAFAGVILVASAFTSALTGALGLGGGLALLALMTLGLPVAAVIPVHGVAQLGSNVSRALVQRRHIDWRAVAGLAVGSLFGAGLGAVVFVSLPEAVLRLGLAAFILWAVYGKKPNLSRGGSDAVLVTGGATSSFASMFFGATGPIVMAVLSTLGLSKHGLVATHAASMVAQHGLKIAAFGTLGFNYGPWLPLLSAIVAAGFVGTLAGSRMLDRLSDRWFTIGFRVVMTLLAAQIAFEGVRRLL